MEFIFIESYLEKLQCVFRYLYLKELNFILLRKLYRLHTFYGDRPRPVY